MTVHLIPALERALSKEDSWDDTSIHASDLGSTLEGETCLRQVCLRVSGAARREQGIGEKLMFDHGHRLHAHAVSLLRAGLADGWSVVGEEVAVNELFAARLGFALTGRYDCALRGPDGELVIVDFKTTRGTAMRFLINEPKPTHRLQLQAYLYATDATYGKLLYIDREGQNGFKEFRVDRDDRAVIDAANKLRAAVESSELPPVLGPKITQLKTKTKIELPWQCEYCRHHKVSCAGADVPEVAA